MKLVVLALVLNLIGMAVFDYFLFQEYRKSIVEKNYKLLQEKGRQIVGNLWSDIAVIEATATSLSAGAHRFQNRDEVRTGVRHILDAELGASLIAGGGIWPEPFKLDTGRERSSVFYAKNIRDRLRFFNDYNDMKNPSYTRDEWYHLGKLAPENACLWSSSYMDPYSLEPMVTCSSGIFEKGKIWGVSTVDLRLEYLRDTLERLSRKLKGYAFAVDMQERFLAYPDLEVSRHVLYRTYDKPVYGEYKRLSDVSEAIPQVAPIASMMKEISQKAIEKAAESEKFDIYRQMWTEQSSEYKEIADMASAMRLTIGAVRDFTTEIPPLWVEMDSDPLHNQPSLAMVFLMPRTFWKVAFVIPLEVARENEKSEAYLRDIIKQQLLFLVMFGLILYGLGRKIYD